jgi:hypothetical protein
MIEDLRKAGWKWTGGAWYHPIQPGNLVDSLTAESANPYVKEATRILRHAVQVIRQWHDLRCAKLPGLSEEAQRRVGDDAWKIYYTHAPEMESIRDVLEPEGGADAKADATSA